jgi:hypothetical protein
MLFQGECPQHRTVSPPSWHALDRAKLAHCRSAGKVSQPVYISPGWRACRTEVEAHDHIRVQRSRPTAKSEAPRDLINVRFAPLCGLRPDISRGPSSANNGREQMQQNVGGRTYSITSSAIASNVGGTVMPSTWAVLRLITRLNLVGSCTGRSAGFSPRRMRST